MSQEQPRSGKRRRRRWIFRLGVLILMPVLLVGCAELLLGALGSGYPTQFLIPATSGKAAGELQENPRFGWRFFPRAIARRPQPTRIAQKSRGDSPFRICVLGGSAAMGDPTPAYGLSRCLQVLLETRFPGQEFEVVNAAMTAINSHVLPDIAQACADSGADLFVVYVGNNEVVGPFGAGTVLGSFSPNRAMIRASLATKRLALGQLMSGWASPDTSETPGSWAGMEMFLEKQVRRSDPKLANVYEHFEANLRQVCDIARSAGVPVLLCSVATNLADCPPFASLHRADLGDQEQASWTARFEEGRAHEAAGDPGQALMSYDQAAEIDAEHAELRFRRGRCLLAERRLDEARVEFLAARDLDTLRFRCDTGLNEILRNLGEELTGQGVVSVDAEGAVAGACSQGIPGQEVLFEHVHLNFTGNYEIAVALLAGVASAAPELGADTGLTLSAGQCRQQLALTLADELETREELLRRAERAPYTHQSGHRQRMIAGRTELVAMQKELAKPAARARAEQMYRTAIQLRREDWILRDRHASFLQLQGRLEEAIEEWREVARLVPHHDEVHHLLAVSLARLGRIDESLAEFEATFERNPEHALAHFNLSQLLASQKKSTKAEEEVRVALKLNPGLSQAWSLLGSLLAGADEHREAAVAYERAVELSPDDLTLRLDFALTLAQAGHKVRARAIYEEAAASARASDQAELAAEIEKKLRALEKK